EGPGQLTWYEFDRGAWVPDVLLAQIEYGHSLQIGDVNRDGDLDIIAAEQILGGNTDATMWLFGGDGTGSFQPQVIASGLDNHESKLADLDDDGDLDILGKPFTCDLPRVDAWPN